MLTREKQIGFQSLRPANTQEATSLNGGKITIPFLPEETAVHSRRCVVRTAAAQS